MIQKNRPLCYTFVMDIKRAKQLQLSGPNGKNYYGGDQDWFSSNTRAQGGCSSVAGANVLRAYARMNRDFRTKITGNRNIPRQIKEALCIEKPSKDCYSILMTGIYNKMHAFEIPILRKIYDKRERNSKFFKILSPNQGQTNTGFIIGIIRFARSMGLDIKVNYMPTAFVSSEKGRDFIEKGLEKSGAVVIMTSYNKHKLQIHSANASLEEKLLNGYESSMRTHFATITDMDGDRVLITTWGKPAIGDYNEISSSWHSIKAFESTLMYIEMSDRASANKCMMNAYKSFLFGIVQSISRGKIQY